MTNKEKQIKDRAYYKYLERGGQNGRDLDDWLEAEKEVGTSPKKKKGSAVKKKTTGRKKTPVKSPAGKKK